MNPKAKTVTKSNLAANKRNQKSRAAKKAAGLHRVRVQIGRTDRNILNKIAQHMGFTISQLIVNCVNACRNEAGKFEQLEEVGCVWESTPSELDLSLPTEIAEALSQYDPVLTCGEVIEILLGRMLNPTWAEHSDEPLLLGSVWDRDICIISDVLMMGHAQAYFRRRNRDFCQAIDPKDEQPDFKIWQCRELHAKWAYESAEREWSIASKLDDRLAVSVPIKGTMREKGKFTEDVIVLNWLQEEVLHD